MWKVKLKLGQMVGRDILNQLLKIISTFDKSRVVLKKRISLHHISIVFLVI